MGGDQFSRRVPRSAAVRGFSRAHDERNGCLRSGQRANQEHDDVGQDTAEAAGSGESPVLRGFARRIGGWRVASSMTTDLILDTLRQAVHGETTVYSDGAFGFCHDSTNKERKRNEANQTHRKDHYNIGYCKRRSS